MVLDLKDCFFFLTIPLQLQDRDKFAFTVLVLNHAQPVKRYQWTVLPQGMINSPTLCQEFVARSLQSLRQYAPIIFYIIIWMISYWQLLVLLNMMNSF